MDEKISFVDNSKFGNRLHLYEVGIHNIKDKSEFTEVEIEQIAQSIKEKFIKELTNKNLR